MISLDPKFLDTKFLFGECCECENRTAVWPIRFTGKKNGVKDDDTPKPRCAFCIWKFCGPFKFKMKTIEDSKCFVSQDDINKYAPSPQILDSRGRPISHPIQRAHAAA